MPPAVTWTGGPRDCHTERSKSDRERQISYITYMSDLKKKKKQFKGTYLQNRKNQRRGKQTYG